MALTKELTTVLDNTEEPLAKRLKLANNAFNSNELPAFNKEGVLLQWFSKIGAEVENGEVWETLHTCLTSQQLREIRQNEIRQDILTDMIKTITKRLKSDIDTDMKKSVLKCSLAILKLDIFQQYFRHDVKRYCIFIATIFTNITDLDELITIISGTLLLNKKKTVKIDYSKLFLSHTFNSIIDILLKFKEQKLFDCCAKLVQRTIFPLNTKTFEEFLTQIFSNDTSKIPAHNLITKLTALYEIDLEKAKIGYKLIFAAFISVHKSETKLIYQFFLVILHLNGFKIKTKYNLNLKDAELNFDLNKSLFILSDIFELINIENITIDESVNELTFNQCLKFLTNSIIRFESQPTLSVLKILKNIIVIDPLIIDESISEILGFICCAKKDEETDKFYAVLLIAMFEMFQKLHRVHKFTSEFLRSLKTVLYGERKRQEPDFEFSGEIDKKTEVKYTENVKEILPVDVIQYFHQCVTLQSSKQVISIMRTFVSHLNDVVSDWDQNTNDLKKTLYLQILSALTCQFLTAIRVAEHTNTEITVKKFLKDMSDLKEILNKFGTSLLKKEHNHMLMFSFLNICHIWGEIGIILTFYKPIDDADFKGKITNDYSAGNITYLHSYLTAAQWSLVSQRIKNFGELPCKTIMLKLIIQKLRTFFLFESGINPAIETSAIANLTTNLEINWDIILSQQFMLCFILPKMENSHVLLLANCLVNDVLERNNFLIFRNRTLLDNRNFITAILYVCLTKINGLFKKKRKLIDDTNLKPLSSKIFQLIDPESFVRKEVVNIEDVSELFCEEIIIEVVKIKISENDFLAYMEIIRHIPVCFLSPNIQITFFIYLLCICIDLNANKTENQKCLDVCERTMLGLLENIISTNILNFIPSDVLIEKIVTNIKIHKRILFFMIHKALRIEDSIPKFKPAAELLKQKMADKRYLEIAVLTVHGINTNKNIKKLKEENRKYLKAYQYKLSRYIVKNLLKQDKLEDCHLDAYVVTLQKYLTEDSEEILAKLLSRQGLYFKYAVDNISEHNLETCVAYFELMLRHKTKVNDLPENFIIYAWRSFKDLKVLNDKCCDTFNKTVSIIFEHVKNEQFPDILKDLLTATVEYMKLKKPKKFTYQLSLWHYMLHSSLNSVKLKLTLKALQKLLEEMILHLLKNQKPYFVNALIKFQINLIENKQIPQTSSLIEAYFQTIQIIIVPTYPFHKFLLAFDYCFSIMEAFLRRRKTLLIDRLPPYLNQYRLVLIQLCVKSNTNLNLHFIDIKKVAFCAFRMEKLTKAVCLMKKDMVRISPYLIADFLKQYEKISLYPEVKQHLNNCLYNLIDLCDSHGEAHLLRVLSPASTELFKKLREDYKKYHKFTGKV